MLPFKTTSERERERAKDRRERERERDEEGGAKKREMRERKCEREERDHIVQRAGCGRKERVCELSPLFDTGLFLCLFAGDVQHPTCSVRFVGLWFCLSLAFL